MYVLDNPIEKQGEEHAIHTGEAFARKWNMDNPKVIQKVADVVNACASLSLLVGLSKAAELMAAGCDHYRMIAAVKGDKVHLPAAKAS